MRALLWRFLAFTALSTVGTAAHFAVLTACVLWWDWGAVAASSAGALTGALINYALNYRFNYRSNAPHARALSRFLIVAFIGFVLNGLLMQGFTAVLGQHFLIAQVLTTLLLQVWYFAANHFWTFRLTEPVPGRI